MNGPSTPSHPTPPQVLPTATLQTLVLNTNSLGDAGAEQVAKAVAGGWRGWTGGARLGRGLREGSGALGRT